MSDFLTGTNSIVGNIFDGKYGINIFPIPQGNDASFWQSKLGNYSGVTGALVYIQNPNLTDSGYLVSGYSNQVKIILSGASSIASQSSGYLYYLLNLNLLGTCHSVSNTGNSMWYDGYNFYNSFHAEGTFSPAYGQNISIFKSNTDGVTALAEDGSCASMTSAEYNDMFGIVSTADADIEASADNVSDNATTFINSPAQACPEEVIVVDYWNETNYAIIGGTSSAISANTFFNTNPIPTSLDNFDYKTSMRYSASGSGAGYVPDGQGGSIPQTQYTIQYNSSGKPIPAFGTGKGTSILNTLICPSITAESSIVVGTQTESQLLIAADILSNPSLGNFDPFNWWNIYHFLFQENSDGFPFSNDYQEFVGDVTIPAGQSSNYGSQLFGAVLSDSTYYWQRRQCPAGINFLPHTFGGTIYACPSYSFEIPYYAAIKKFGFYGTRFFNGCLSIEMDDESEQGQPNSQDLPYSPPVTYTVPGSEEPDPDVGINYSNSVYDNLLNIANQEELHSDFYALNRGFFIWANSGLIAQMSQFQSLSGNVKFLDTYNGLIAQYNGLFPNGPTDFLKNNYLFEKTNQLYDTGIYSPILSNNQNYITFINQLNKSFTGITDSNNWAAIESTYSNAVMTSSSTANTGFYYSLQTGRQSRFFTRYLENYVKGNPIDLYPTNKIYFNYDKASDYIESSGWGKATVGEYPFGANNHFDPAITKRYFLGAYAGGQDISGFSTFLNGITNINLSNSYFYPGFFNTSVGAELPIPTYYPVITGDYDSTNSSSFNYESIQTNQFPALTNGWNLLGYNGIGALNGNFSCFTPIFVQNPFPVTHCKIGQAPAFRSFAVDYHTIPEDKMNNRYPEIMYWMDKLKIGDSNYKNRYPLSYKWYRIAKDDCTGLITQPDINDGDFQMFLLNPDFSNVIPSNPTGDWCCLEGDGPNCTMIHPTECLPPYPYGTNGGPWAYGNQNNPEYQIGVQNNYNMTLVKGAQKDDDDQYYYFCMVTGRFGVRISEPSQLFIEDWIDLDISVRNGANVGGPNGPVTFPGGSLSLSLQTNDGEVISFPSSQIQPYQGFVWDSDAVPEDIIQAKIPPPNAGFGDVYSYTFVGPWGYRGAAQTYTPGTLIDTRGLQETWGRMLDYGSLIHYHSPLTQDQGETLYGRNHLPTCNNTFTMSDKQDGIRVVINGIVHWANIQTPIADTNGNYGVMWNKLGNAGELYIPASNGINATIATVSPGIGQWQYGNNLGTIHSFGWNSKQLPIGTVANEDQIEDGDLSCTPYALSTGDFQTLKNNLLKGGILGGNNCGWQKYGLGRNMSYWIEGFSSFYLYCDPIKKKNVYNFNYMSPGLRQTNSSIQYFWLGKPTNTYLERYPMFGPYAYQWKVNRHNRDRNGNGISQGFYSYGWNQNYTLMYDNPAIYGLFMKYGSSTRDINGINQARLAAVGSQGSLGLKTTSFGFTNGEGTSQTYGNIWIGLMGTGSGLPPSPNPTANAYVISGVGFAQTPEFNLYGCSDEDLKAGRCFDACISMRYQNGFMPGGKMSDMASYFGDYQIVANSPTGALETIADDNGVYFRGPFGAPNFQYLTTGEGVSLNGFSPCFDGGSDHCNYITPTINIGASMYYESIGISMLNNAMLASQNTSF